MNRGNVTPALAAGHVTDHGLRIEIFPRAYDWWRGTSAQLQEEGVVPAGFDWPKGRDDREWVSGPFEFWLCRTRPEGHRGPLASWLEVDYWMCRRVLASLARDGLAAARLHEKRQAIEAELWSYTPAGAEQRRRYWKAREDGCFQAFKALVVPPPKRRGRPRKTQAGATPTNSVACPPAMLAGPPATHADGGAA